MDFLTQKFFNNNLVYTIATFVDRIFGDKTRALK